MRRYLLPEGAKPYKVNLHSHSVYSDGNMTPQEIKETFKELGYSAVAFTEHEMLFDFTELNDENFIAITSYEYDFNTAQGSPSAYHSQKDPKSFSFQECMHLNLYARDPHNVKMVCHNPKHVFCGDAPNYLDRAQYIGDGSYHQEFTVDCFNDVIKTANENGFLVVYNHPLWSMNTHETYSKLRGLIGMEIINGSSHAPHVYDEMLRSGQRLICVGGDDNHGRRGCGKAWTVIFADSLDHESLIAALERGDCYASFGPRIDELYVENGRVNISCSPAREIKYTCGGRKGIAKRSCGITEAVFDIGCSDEYFRITVTDSEGRCAHTRAYHIDELSTHQEVSSRENDNRNAGDADGA